MMSWRGNGPTGPCECEPVNEKPDPKTGLYNTNPDDFSKLGALSMMGIDGKPGFYMVYVEGHSMPRVIHETYDSAYKEAVRLAVGDLHRRVYILETIKVVSVPSVPISVKKVVSPEDFPVSTT